MSNPYLDEFLELFDGNERPDLLSTMTTFSVATSQDIVKRYDSRHVMCKKYGWCIPNEAALKAIAAHGSVVEIGAGSGYWASLLASRGIDVVAYDNRSTHTFDASYFPVQFGEPPRAADHSDRTLLLVWPPYGSPMATRCVKHWRGDVLAYAGESDGCTAHSSFENVLIKLFEQIDEVSLPQWPGMHDYLRIFRRKKSARNISGSGPWKAQEPEKPKP